MADVGPLRLKDAGEQERETRRSMWDRLLEADGPLSVPPNLLRDLSIYGGAQGVWVDQATDRPRRCPRIGLLGRANLSDLTVDPAVR
jgi:hypothetical protein